MRNKKVTYTLNAIGLILIITLMAFQSHSSDSQMVVKRIIELHQPNDQYFISQKDIENLINRQYDSLEEIPVKEINIALLEDSIEQIPFVEKAEVYSTLDGRLNAIVYQNKAIARVQVNNKEFYLNANGSKMPLSKQYSAMVPRITGQVDSTKLYITHQFLMYTNNDPFYKSFFSGIDYSSNNITLYPSNGSYTIEFGEIDEMKLKLEKFKIFYQSSNSAEDIKKLKKVSLIYSDQVVYLNK